MESRALALIEEPRPEDVAALTDGLGAFNFAATADKSGRRFALVARENGAVIGGTIANAYWGWCYIELLWVREEFRGRGLGRSLLAAAERQIAGYGIRNVYLDTFSWQALPFYQKHGYVIFGQLENFPPPHTKYFLRKTL